MDVYDLAYHCAYTVFPRLSLGSPEQFENWRLRSENPSRMLYFFVCMVLEVEPLPADSERFRWRGGKLTNGQDYVVIEYPLPEPVTATFQEIEARATVRELRAAKQERLLPYFSALVGNLAEAGERQVYALGQSPARELTTLRRVTLAGHYNLGFGPEPTFEAFTEMLADAPSRQPVAATILDPERSDASDAALGAQLQSLSESEIDEQWKRKPN